MSTTERVVNKKLLASLVRESKTVKERTSSIAGTFGERVQAASENGHLNKRAMRVVSALYRMKDDAARDKTIRDIPLYIDMLREEGLFPQENGELFEGQEQDGDEDGGAEDENADDAGGGDEDGDAGHHEITGTADDALAAMDKAHRGDRDPVAAHAEDEWNKADPANGAPADKPKGGRGKGMGTAPGSYKMN